ncbi:hypothetical protein HMPREF2534_02017 [Bacteroides thetaiotaomicron]|jgi:hypothetical protein|nr:hypothetical protein HMPREF2534_02017 [Bacteroides thetaiotaomicron]
MTLYYQHFSYSPFVFSGNGLIVFQTISHFVSCRFYSIFAG